MTILLNISVALRRHFVRGWFLRYCYFVPGWPLSPRHFTHGRGVGRRHLAHGRSISLMSITLLLLLQPWSLRGQSPDTTRDHVRFSAFPQQRLFPRLLADGTSHQLGIDKDLLTRQWLGHVGAMRPVAEVTFCGHAVQAGIGATVHTSILREPGVLQVVTADFSVDFPVDIKVSETLVLRTGYGHFSAHLVDDGIEILQKQSVNYAKDFLTLLGAFALPVLGGHVYGGGRWDFHSLPEESSHWVVQCGLEAGNVLLRPDVRLYAAMDIKLKSEVAWGSTQSYQFGIKFFERSGSALRVAYTYRTGFDDRGQFYRERTTFSLVGVFFDF